MRRQERNSCLFVEDNEETTKTTKKKKKKKGTELAGDTKKECQIRFQHPKVHEIQLHLFTYFLSVNVM